MYTKNQEVPDLIKAFNANFQHFWSVPKMIKVQFPALCVKQVFVCATLKKCFHSLMDGQVNRCQYASGTVEHHFGELNATRSTFISIYLPEGPFQSHAEPTFKTVIPYMRGHSCACPGTK